MILKNFCVYVALLFTAMSAKIPILFSSGGCLGLRMLAIAVPFTPAIDTLAEKGGARFATFYSGSALFAIQSYNVDRQATYKNYLQLGA